MDNGYIQTEGEGFAHLYKHLAEGNTHTMKSSGNALVACLECGKTVQSKNLTRHMKCHTFHPYKCGRCTIFFSSQEEAEAHRLKKHSKERYICSYCGMKYKFPSSLRDHISTKHEDKSKRFKCEICDKGFCRIGHLEDHMNMHSDVSPYMCSRCSRSYNNRSAFNRHCKTCGLDNRYACEECGQVYKSFEGRKEHVNRVHKKVTYLCQCGTSFRTRANRARHTIFCDAYEQARTFEKGDDDSLNEQTEETITEGGDEFGENKQSASETDDTEEEDMAAVNASIEALMPKHVTNDSQSDDEGYAVDTEEPRVPVMISDKV